MPSTGAPTDVPFPTVPDKHAYSSAYPPAAFLDALRADGWEPGPVPQSVRLHRANGVRAQEMEAAALFALGQVRGLPVASALVIDAVPDRPGIAFRINHQRAGQVLQELFTATIAFLAG